MADAPTITPPSSPIVLLAKDIKLSHSVFALPFALLATFLASAEAGRLPGWDILSLVVACMVLARTMAMSVNRWADANLDAANPRTARRAIPSGRLSSRFVGGAAIVCALAFIAVTSGFYFLHRNPWPLVLSPIVLAWLAGYSYTKRFTWLCHVFLGVALAMSPVAAAIAVYPAVLARPDIFLLALMVACWVAGFDVIYALQDVEVDRAKGLFSMPSRLGVEPALWVSRAMHLIALASLALLAKLSPHLGAAFAVGIVLVAALLILEHAIVWKSKTHHIDIAFFTLNGVISLLLGGLGIFDVIRTVR